jgi:hypothetical protein
MNLSTQFEYAKLSRAIDSCQDIEALKEQTKALLKLYFSQKQIALNLLLPNYKEQ